MNDIRRPANSLVRFAGVPRFIASLALAVLIALFGSGLLFAQQLQQASPLTLRQAVNIALEKNPQRKAALADTRAATADVKQARSFLLPHVTFSETATAATIRCMFSAANCGNSVLARPISLSTS